MSLKPEATLFISYRFPPDLGVGCLRNAHFAELNSKFRETVVLTSKNGIYLDKSRIYDGSFETHFIDNKDIKSKLHRILPRLFTSFLSRTGIHRYILRSGRNSKARQAVYEGGSKYVSSAIQAYYEIDKKYAIKYIYSSYRPMVDHEIALNIKKEFPKVSWIADFRDYPPSYQKLTPVEYRLYQNIFDSADKVLYSTKGLARYFNSPPTTSRVIYSAHEKYSNIQHKSDKFIICYAGSLYGKRPLDAFFSGLKTCLQGDEQMAEKVELRYLGINQKIWDTYTKKYGLSRISRSTYLKTHDEALDHITRSDLLLYLDWSDQHVNGLLGYKVWDYLTTSLPIMSISHGKPSEELQALLTDDDFFGHHASDPVTIAQYIKEVYEDRRKINRQSVIKNQLSKQMAFWENPA